MASRNRFIFYSKLVNFIEKETIADASHLDKNDSFTVEKDGCDIKSL